MIELSDGKYVLVNLINGNADVLDGAVANRLFKGSFFELDSATLQQLIDRQYIFSSMAERDAYLDEANQRLLDESKREVPNFIVVPTYACNLDCYYCFERASVSQDARCGIESAFDANDFFDFADRIVGSYRAEFGEFEPSDVIVTVTGGEPLQSECKANIEAILEGSRQRGFRVDFVTNGLNIPEFYELLARFSSTIDGFQITLDGAKDVHDSIRVSSGGEPTFNSIIRSLTLLDEAGFNTSVRINATRLNIESIGGLGPVIERFGNVLFYVYLLQQEGCCQNENVIPELEGIRLLDDLKASYNCLDGLLVEFHGRRLVEAIFDGRTFHPKIKICAAMSNQYIFDCAGSVFKCWWAMGAPERAIATGSGEVRQWNVDLLRAYHQRNVLQMRKCRSCKYRYVCGGGCTGKLGLSDLLEGAVSCPDFHSILDYEVRRNLGELSNGGDRSC